MTGRQTWPSSAVGNVSPVLLLVAQSRVLAGVPAAVWQATVVIFTVIFVQPLEMDVLVFTTCLNADDYLGSHPPCGILTIRPAKNHEPLRPRASIGLSCNCNSDRRASTHLSAC